MRFRPPEAARRVAPGSHLKGEIAGYVMMGYRKGGRKVKSRRTPNTYIRTRVRLLVSIQSISLGPCPLNPLPKSTIFQRLRGRRECCGLICLTKSKAPISFRGHRERNKKIEYTSSRPPQPPFGMALREMPLTLCRLTTRAARPVFTTPAINSRRYASGEASSTPDVAADLQDLEPQNSFATSEYPAEKIKAFDPIKRSQGRTRQLPPSRYVANGS